MKILNNCGQFFEPDSFKCLVYIAFIFWKAIAVFQPLRLAPLFVSNPQPRSSVSGFSTSLGFRWPICSHISIAKSNRSKFIVRSLSLLHGVIIMFRYALVDYCINFLPKRIIKSRNGKLGVSQIRCVTHSYYNHVPAWYNVNALV